MGESSKMSYTAKQKSFIDSAKSWAETNGKDISSVTKTDLTDIADFGGLKFPTGSRESQPTRLVVVCGRFLV